ncbi:hypothetical protein [Endozoicomonas sp.]|uniref:hypothetical protein n=1 Tax=Endozoicomonas sp. TaxID=1892382 RepID=UPI003AF6DDDD
MNGISGNDPSLFTEKGSNEIKREEEVSSKGSDSKAAMKFNKALSNQSPWKKTKSNGREVDRSAPPKHYMERAREGDKASQKSHKAIVKCSVRLLASQKTTERPSRIIDRLEILPEECIGLKKSTVEEFRKLGILENPGEFDNTVCIGLSTEETSMLRDLGFLAESEASSDGENCNTGSTLKGAKPSLEQMEEDASSRAVQQRSGAFTKEMSSPRKPLLSQQERQLLKSALKSHNTEPACTQIREFLCCWRSKSPSSVDGKSEKRRTPM